MMWQQDHEGDWVLGKCIRGLVRSPVASVYYCEDVAAWRWNVKKHGAYTSGYELNLTAAVEKCEEYLGITGD